MSLLGSFFKAAGGALTGFIAGGPAGAAVGALSAFAPQPSAQRVSAVGALPAMVRQIAPAVPIARGAIQAIAGKPFIGARPGLDILGAACPTGWHLDKRTRSRCVRNRRMNPLNGRAAFRAIRRIKGARKMLQKIERQLPRTKARAVPRHGHRVDVTAT